MRAHSRLIKFTARIYNKFTHHFHVGNNFHSTISIFHVHRIMFIVLLFRWIFHSRNKNREKEREMQKKYTSNSTSDWRYNEFQTKRFGNWNYERVFKTNSKRPKELKLFTVRFSQSLLNIFQPKQEVKLVYKWCNLILTIK